MKIVLSPNFFEILNNKNLLLDTSVFIDAYSDPYSFFDLFKELKEKNIRLLTVDLIKIEFLKGMSTDKRYKDRESFYNRIIDEFVIVDDEILQNTFKLLERYRQYGGALSVTDAILGGTLMTFSDEVFLLTKNTVDFSTNIFEVVSYMNLIKQRSIQAYGVYKFKK